MERALYVITGVMSSGKSTVVELLALKTNKCVHLRGDAFRTMIITEREDMSAQPSKEAKILPAS